MTYTRAGESHGFGQAQGAPHACEDQPTLRRSVRGTTSSPPTSRRGCVWPRRSTNSATQFDQKLTSANWRAHRSDNATAPAGLAGGARFAARPHRPEAKSADPPAATGAILPQQGDRTH